MKKNTVSKGKTLSQVKKTMNVASPTIKTRNRILTSMHIDSAVTIQQQIAEKAYELYQQRGCQDGNDLADWLEAEQIIKSRN